MSIHINYDLRKTFSFLQPKNLISKFQPINLLYLALLLHLAVMPFPMDGYIFDEVHYLNAARATLLGNAANAEHPPLAKILYAGSIGIFGDWWFAWRIVPAICAVLALYFFFRISKNFFSERKALVATSFLMFDTLFFVNTSVAILDAPALLFGFVGLERFLSKKWKTSAIAFAIACLMKETALFILIATIVWYALRNVRWRKVKNKVNLKTFGVFTLVFLAVSMGGLWTYDLAFKPSTGTTVTALIQQNVVVDQNQNPITTYISTVLITYASPITNPIGHIQFAFEYYKSLVPAINANASDYRPPWGWILPADNTFNPPPYLVVAVTAGGITKIAINWVSIVSPPIAFMYIPLLGIAIALLLKRRNTELAGLVAVWSIVAYVPWLLLGLFVQRMTFNYYFIYTVPALCLGIPMFWDALPLKRNTKIAMLITQLTSAAVWFIMYYPINLFR